jgi:CheY-like chemotaxis protein
MIDTQTFDLVLMDLRMPVMDGLTAIRHIRRRADDKAGLPVIVVTADDGASVDADCRAAGADDVMHKPISMSALFGAIGAIVARRGDSPAAMIA